MLHFFFVVDFHHYLVGLALVECKMYTPQNIKE